EVGRPRLLAQPPAARPIEDVEAGGIGHQITAVLAAPRARRAPVAESVQGEPYRGGGLAEHLHHLGGGHLRDGRRRRHPPRFPPPGGRGRLAPWRPSTCPASSPTSRTTRWITGSTCTTSATSSRPTR